MSSSTRSTSTTHPPGAGSRHRRPAAALAALAATIGLVATLAEPAYADQPTPREGTVIAADTASGETDGFVVASGPNGITVNGTVVAPAITAVADAPRSISVRNHGIRPVSLYAKGERRRTVMPRSDAAVRFRGLTAGRVYVVVVGGSELGRLTAVSRPTAAAGLTVRTTATPGTVVLTWRHRTSAATGGRRTWYDVTATSATARTVRTRVTATRTARLAGLDDSSIYAFTVTPRNSAGPGRSTRAEMTRTLAQLRPTPAPSTSQPTGIGPATPVPPPLPAPPPPTPPVPPAPTTPSSPPTRTIYVCPPDSTRTTADTCVMAEPYTFTTKAYTFHPVVVAPAPVLDEYPTSVRACPSSHNLEDYGWVMYCRRYGSPTIEQVKDDPPVGFTDDGTAWVRKDPAPAGYTDDGSQWIRTVPKVARTVPA